MPTRAEPYPKIELHVHLEGTVRAPALREIAGRNGYPLPHGVDALYRTHDFRTFIEAFDLIVGATESRCD